MPPRLKKALWLIVKLVVFVALLDYARRHAQLDDELTVMSPSAASGLALPVGARLRVLQPSSIARAVYDVRAPDGRELRVPAAAVETTTAVQTDAAFVLLPGIRSVLTALRWREVVSAFLVFGPALFLMAVRWDVLLRAAAIHIPFATLVRLHYLGFFYNAFMPGGAGGDIVKAVYLSRHCSQKAEAATVVVVDRVVGLLGLLAVAAAVIPFAPAEARGIAGTIGALALCLVLGSALFFSSTVRRAIRYDAWVGKLPGAPMLHRIDSAIYGFRYHKRQVGIAFAITVAIQALEIYGVSLAGDALGLSAARWAHYVVFVPVGFLVNSIPLSFGGIGLMEGAYLKMFHDAGVATATQGFMLGVLTRLIVLAWSALGAISALFPPATPATASPAQVSS